MSKPVQPKIYEYLEYIVDYVQQKGRLEGSINPTLLSLKTIYRAITPGNKYFRPDVKQAIDEAFAYYRRTNLRPEDDPECRETALEQFKKGIKAGNSYTIEQTYNEKGKPHIKLFRKPGISQWEWEVIFPKKTVTEQAILTITANQLNDLATDQTLTEDQRRVFLAWLSRFIDKSTQELQKQGLSTKMLDTYEYHE